MNKILSAITAACLCASAAAETVSISDARIHACKFFGGNPELTPIGSGLILGKTESACEPTFYVFNNPSGGWLILSAENSTNPVLACSDSGSFPTSGFSPATVSWLSGMDAGITSLRASHPVPSARIKAQWESIGVKTKAGGTEKILETAKWGQAAPFNNLCPQIGGNSTVTGCIATAMAIVCRYHQWPENGKGTTTAYTTATNKLSIPSTDFSTHSYKWTNMPLEYDGQWTAAQKSAVASLMRDCGVMVQMDYGLASGGGSGAYARDMTNAFKSYLSYSGNCRIVVRQHMDTNEWFSTIAAEIDAGRPLIYSGTTSDSEGHAFVCDGYDYRKMIHINWGWNGKCDGFFALTWLGDDGDPDEGYVGYVFSNYEEVALGIEPDKSGTSGGEAAELFLYSQNDFSGISLKSGSIKKGESFTIDVGYALNNSKDADYSGKIKLVLQSRNGIVKENISNEMPVSINKISDNKYSAAYASDITCKINGTVAPGDAIAVMYTMPDGSWTRMGGDPDQNTVSLMGAYDVCFIANTETYNSGECIYPSLVQGHGAVRKVEWYWDGKLMDKGYAAAESGSHTLKAVVTMVSGITETVVHPIKVN